MRRQLALVLLVSASCSRAEHPTVVLGPCAIQAAAVSAASKVVGRTSSASRFVISRARGQDVGELWNVWVPFAAAQMPEEALIKVRKADCTCEWVPVI